MANKTKSNQPKPRECQCGCGEHTKGGRYAQGHDARHKSALIEAALGGGKRAVAQLEALGWKKFLDAKLARMGRRAVETVTPTVAAPEITMPEPVKRKRGRPRKNNGAAASKNAAMAPVASTAPAAPVSALRRAASRLRLGPVESEIVS